MILHTNSDVYLFLIVKIMFLSSRRVMIDCMQFKFSFVPVVIFDNLFRSKRSTLMLKL